MPSEFWPMSDFRPRPAHAVFCKRQQKGKLHSTSPASSEPFSLIFSQDWLTWGLWKNNLYYISCLPLAEVWKKTKHVYSDHLLTSTRGSSADLPALDTAEKCTLSAAPAGGMVFLHISMLYNHIPGKKLSRWRGFKDYVLIYDLFCPKPSI